MFIVKKKESFNRTIRMPGDLIQKLERIAQKEDISFNQLVIQCCEDALNDMQNPSETQPQAVGRSV